MTVSFLEELKRRNVLRAAAAYLAVSWLLIQVVETVFPAFGFGGTDVRIVIIVLVIGLIPVLIFSWAFELTPEGLKDESEKYLAELIEQHATEASLEVASVFAGRGDNDNAFVWLEEARENNEMGIGSVAAYYAFRNLHDDSRWQPFLAKMGQSDAQLAAIEFNVLLPEQRPK